METAKVDIRKLQLLNDRINQCLEALNQVRLSVHGLASAQGLSHTSVPFAGVPGINPGIPYGGTYGSFAGMTPGTGINPAFGLGQAFGQGAQGQGFVPGLSHTGGLPGIGGLSGFSPYFAAGGAETGGPEAALRPMWSDPFLTARITQTFPYAQFPVPPAVTIY